MTDNLHKLLQTYNPNEIKKIIIKNPNFVNEKYKNGITLFMLACMKDDIEIVKLLINHPKFNTLNNKDKTNNKNALMLVCENQKGKNCLEIIKLIIKNSKFIGIDDKNINKQSVFMMACCRSLEMTKLILNHPKFSGIDDKNLCGYTGLMIACIKEQTQIVKLILKKSNINKTDINGISCFMFACQSGNLELVKLIINDRRFSGINNQNKQGFTALMFACQNTKNNDKIVELILKNNNFKSINYQNNNGFTALMYACENGNYQIIKMILEHHDHKTLNVYNVYKYTAFMLAYQYRSIDIINLFLKKAEIYYQLNHMCRSNSVIENKQEIINIYRENPQKYRQRLILEDNIDIFYFILFASNGYFDIKKSKTKNKTVKRMSKFMRIVIKLPLELQMFIVNIYSGFNGFMIPNRIIDQNIKNFIENYC
jgi:ankyrin repeat protein